MLGMGYANEALHLPGISKRLEFDLAMKSNDLKRAGIYEMIVLGLDLIDAADATAQGEIAREALKRLAAAGSVKGALQGHELRGLALRLANHGELTRLNGLVNNLITLGLGWGAAFAGAVLGDNALMEKAWQDTGMLAEAVLHAHAHGRPTLKNLVQAWNQMLQREIEPTPSQKTDATAAFLASLEEPKLTSLAEAGKKPPIEILPPGMMSLDGPISIQKKPGSAALNSQQLLGKPLALPAPPTTTAMPEGATQQQPESTSTPPAPVGESTPEGASSDSKPASEAAPPQPESGETKVEENGGPPSAPVSEEDPAATGENVQTVSPSDPVPPETTPSPVAETPENNVPTTAPASNPLV